MNNLTRRSFLTKTASMGLVGSTYMLHALGLKSAVAAQTGGYKALVCINLKGGMDHADTVIPTDNASYSQLLSARRELLDSYEFDRPESSRNRTNLLELNAINNDEFSGRTFGLPKELAGLHSMFEQEEAAIIANVGPLLEPTNRVTMNAGGLLPPRLFSHNDQQSTWQTLSTEGARFGWGGGFVDAALASNPTANALFSAITASSSDAFLAGTRSRQFSVPLRYGGGGINVVNHKTILGMDARFNNTRRLIADFLETPDTSYENVMRQDVAASVATGISNMDQFNQASQLVLPVGTEFPNDTLGQQMGAVAQTIALRDALNTPRQVFYVTLGGFDTHANQTTALPAKHEMLSNALSAFKEAMLELDIWNDVAVFTMSDFGRTLSDNGDGTDHGWGSHHFVLGGNVRGKRIFGDIPEPDNASDRFTSIRARMIPTLSVEQYASSLGSWFGLDDQELATLFPNLTRFDADALNLFNA